MRLEGPSANPDAIGASIRVVYGDEMGPAREVQAGAGYWSHDGVTTVLGLRAEPSAVWVRWPGGKETRTPVEPGVRELTIRVDGAPRNRN